MRGIRRAAAVGAVALMIALVGCSPALPETVVPGTEVVVGWTGEFTSTNAAASPTTGNIDVAEMIRGDFGDIVDGDFVPDESFGTVTIVSDDPFTVRYDLTEPSWSDNVPLDAADLLVGWAATAGYFDEESAESDATGASAVYVKVPSIDEFARSVDVTAGHPVNDWQSAVTAPVPAHVLGSLALGIDDAMEAKQAVITAIQANDEAALQKMADVWKEGFALGDDTDIPKELLLSSGPFVVDEVTGSGVGLVPNVAYRGAATPQVARIELVPPGEDPISAMGGELDVVQMAPVNANQEPIRELERKDFVVNITHDGTVWAVLLKPSGIFTGVQARTAFLHAVPPSTLTDGGAGEWRAAYTASTSMTTAAESRAYEIVNEDSGFTQRLGSTEGDPPLEREAAGVATGASVCVLYDRASEFAVGAFAAMRAAAAEAGWNVVDCGTDDFDAAIDKGGWDAVIARVPVPRSPADIAAQWGSGGAASITGQSDPARDELITQLEQTTDIYEARDISAQIEAAIVRAAVALPLAANPVLTIVDRDVTGVAAGNGSIATLTPSAALWMVTP